jgi:hypothetical protein
MCIGGVIISTATISSGEKGKMKNENRIAPIIKST